jgi:hypothetical protein
MSSLTLMTTSRRLCDDARGRRRRGRLQVSARDVVEGVDVQPSRPDVVVDVDDDEQAGGAGVGGCGSVHVMLKATPGTSVAVLHHDADTRVQVESIF